MPNAPTSVLKPGAAFFSVASGNDLDPCTMEVTSIDSRDYFLHKWIIGMLSEEVIGKGIETAAKVWKKLENYFVKKCREIEFILEYELECFHQVNISIIDYVIKKILHEIKQGQLKLPD
ncbi:hypothetical protein NE237_015565 [Protea cynaroides]|uniref:Uncharacterized protein n=1 Tax=Protea cynaroides TaxID=273540 RepID=A0A9Q0QRB9_9MAGN|nr:hypothetical protein NE237_015565 [Protea cynaroides]